MGNPRPTNPATVGAVPRNKRFQENLTPVLPDSEEDLYKGKMTKQVAAHILGFRPGKFPTDKPATIAESDDNRGVGKVWKPKGRK